MITLFQCRKAAAIQHETLNCFVKHAIAQRAIRFNNSRRRQIILQHFRFSRRRFSFIRCGRVCQDFDRLVERIPLHRRAAGFADGFDQFAPNATRGLNDRCSQMALVTAKRLRVVGLPRGLNIRCSAFSPNPVCSASSLNERPA